MGLFDGKKFKCDACGGKFKTEAELMEHSKMHVAGSQSGMSSGNMQVQQFECKACGMKFNTQAELVEHSKKSHAM